jgi:hypothetical protein
MSIEDEARTTVTNLLKQMKESNNLGLVALLSEEIWDVMANIPQAERAALETQVHAHLARVGITTA